MLSWFKKSRAPVTFDSPDTGIGPIAVIGDLHGSDGLLKRLLLKLADDADSVARIIFVGDYVDRGENSAQVLRLVMSLQDESPERIVCLMGNHERMMLDFLNTPSKGGKRWMRYGGAQTLGSFGIPPVPVTASEDMWVAARDQFEYTLGPKMVDWLRALPLCWHSGNVAVVHAGADPAKPITEQSEDALLWGHPDFDTRPRKDGLWVAHGHTVVSEASADQGRIATDTGAYASGRLTAALIDGGPVQFVQT